jgi:hypothetical protein
LNNNAYLKNIDANVAYEPTFREDILNYTAYVPYKTTTVTVERHNSYRLRRAYVPYKTTTVTVGGESQDINASVKIQNKSLSLGDNIIPITVTAEDGVTKREYYLSITRMNNEARLKPLTATDGLFSTGFSKNKYEYTLTLPSKVVYVDIDGTTVDPNAHFSGKVRVWKPTVGNTEIATLHVAAEDTIYYKDYKVICKWKSDDNQLAHLEVKGYKANAFKF